MLKQTEGDLHTSTVVLIQKVSHAGYQATTGQVVRTEHIHGIKERSLPQQDRLEGTGVQQPYSE